MKYIRTNNKVFAVKEAHIEDYEVGYFITSEMEKVDAKDAKLISENLEDLCDEFVLDYESEKRPRLDTSFQKAKEDKVAFIRKDNYSFMKFLSNHAKSNFYLANWTSSGLTYVAKWTEKGWELI